MLNKQSPMPMYFQIEENLKQRIAEGEFHPGDAIPSERELSEYYDVSRMTVRQAVTNLVSEDILFREKGKGTFVAVPKIEQPLSGLTSFTEDMRARGMEPSSRLLSFSSEKPSADLCRKLRVDPSQDVYCVKRIRFADEKPMAVEVTYIPVHLFPALSSDEVQQSFYSYVENQNNMKIGYADQTIEAKNVTEETAPMLGVEPPSAVLLIERISYLSDGVPFEVVRSTYRADRYKFSSNIARL